jgi:Sulfotransferase domain
MTGENKQANNPPDFVIPGAPRTGTTFMYDYLAQHPQIYMSPIKEPNHFATDLDSGSYLDSLTFLRDKTRYDDMYDAARPDQLTGEASTWYLYSRQAAANLKANNPATRAVIMLREPVSMLHSLHLRRVYGGSEDLKSFEDALAAEPDRRAGKRIPPKARNVKALFYRDVGSYAAQVRRYYDELGRDQVLVLIFEEFRKDPAAAYRSVLEFLGVDADFKPDFDVVNAGLARRSWRLQQMMLSPVVIKTARVVVPMRLRPAVGRTWDRVNSRGEKPAPLDPAVARALREELQPDVDQLEQLIGRDLSSIWPTPGSG